MQVCSPMVSLLSVKSNPTQYLKIFPLSPSLQKKQTRTIYLPAGNSVSLIMVPLGLDLPSPRNLPFPCLLVL